MTAFGIAFGSTFLAISEVAIVVAGAWALAARRVVTPATVKGLSDISVFVFLPCLLFSNIIDTFQPAEHSLWWVVPLLAAAMFLGSTLIATLAFARDLGTKRDTIPLAAMQNAGYLVLPVGQVLLPDDFDRFALYCFLYLLMFTPLFWSVGKFLTTSGPGGDGGAFRWRGLVTPPLVANLAALALVFTGARVFIPGPAAAAVRLVGSAAIPVAVFLLGASLGGMAHRYREHLADALRTISVKLMIIPLVTILLLSRTGLRESDPTLALMLVLQAASPPAINIMLQINTYGGNLERSGTIILLNYIAALLTIPLWVAVWQVIG
jgi:predicted permease